MVFLLTTQTGFPLRQHFVSVQFLFGSKYDRLESIRNCWYTRGLAAHFSGWLLVPGIRCCTSCATMTGLRWEKTETTRVRGLIVHWSFQFLAWDLLGRDAKQLTVVRISPKYFAVFFNHYFSLTVFKLITWVALAPGQYNLHFVQWNSE